MVPELVTVAAERWPDTPAVIDGERVWTFAELASEVERAARAYIAAGLRPGDRVAIWAPNIAEWVPAALGALAAGGIVVPLNTRYRGREAAYVLERTRARLLVTVSGFLDTDYPALLREAVGGPTSQQPTAELAHLERIVLLRGTAAAPDQTWAEFLAAGEHTDPAEVQRRTAALEPDDVADIIFTSGTTGAPKGAMATHAQDLWVFRTWAEVVGLQAGDRYLIVNPFFHTFGYKAGILASLMMGATIIPMAVFDPGQALRLIATHRVTVLPGPPTLYRSLIDHPDRAHTDTSSLRLVVTGAAVVPVALIREIHDVLGVDEVLTAYGLTEATGVVTMCRRGDDVETIAHTSGRAIPGVEVRVVDDEGRPLPPGQPGEVLVRGPNVMPGYWEDPERTAETIVDGWLHTGDIGVLDEQGNLRITDRKKDMFIVGGFNAYPAEIEQLLLAHPDIGQVAVVGVPDERLGEVGWAFVVPKPGHTVDPDDVIVWARGQMANYKVPRRVIVVDALPLNASGKVLKGELRERARAMLEEAR